MRDWEKDSERKRENDWLRKRDNERKRERMNERKRDSERTGENEWRGERATGGYGKEISVI